MVAFCADTDVEARLERELTTEEDQYIAGKIEEAQVMVIGYLGCSDDPYATIGDVPTAVKIVTSRIVARVIEQAADAEPGTFGADQVGNQVGPFGRQITYTKGTRDKAPWLTKADLEALAPYRCDNKAFSVDTAATSGSHAETCSLWLGATYCSCGADIAGSPLYGC
jgi:hypothetical protein